MKLPMLPPFYITVIEGEARHEPCCGCGTSIELTPNTPQLYTDERPLCFECGATRSFTLNGLLVLALTANAYSMSLSVPPALAGLMMAAQRAQEAAARKAEERN